MIEEKVGKHLLLNGDTNEGMEYLNALGHKVDYILTSPPYNAHRTDFYNGSDKINDSKDNEEYKQWLITHFKEYDSLLKQDGVIIYNINYMSSLKNNASNLFRVITEIEDKTNFVLIEQICWKKRKGTPSKEARLTRVWENVFIFIRKSDWKTFHQKFKNILVGKPNYIEAPNNDFANDINKACFSSSMVEQLLKLYGANKDSVVLDNFMGCYDKETQVLTNNGWKFFEEVDIDNDLFLSRKNKTKETKFVKAKEKIVKHYNGDMFVFDGKINFSITPNHNVVCAKRNSETDKNVRNVMKNEEFIKADKIYNKNIFIPISHNFIDGKKEEFIKIGEKNIEIKDFMKIFGYFITDGYCKKARNNNYYMTISQSKNEKIINEIRDVLSKYYKVHENLYQYKHYKVKHTFIIHDYALGNYFKKFGEKNERWIPNELLKYNEEISKILLESIIDGDGDFLKRDIINTVSLKMVDSLQHLIALCGKSSKVYIKKSKINSTMPLYVVKIFKNDYIHITKNNYKQQKWEKYNDNVYCVALEENNTLFVRRKYTTSWNGNTGTTAIGCEKIGCRSIGIELDKATYNFSKDRIREYIGEFEKVDSYNLFNHGDDKWE